MLLVEVQPVEVDYEQQPPERIDRLGDYFKGAKVRETYGFTFEEFVEKVESGAWEKRLEP